ncbi:MAG: ice-binding family protein, partial [Actinomycetota bacterium]|nr:ice-binding family protein [Actinomycetota bacterium]
MATTPALFDLLSLPSLAHAAEAPVGLGTAGAYSVLGGVTVTNTGPSRLSGNLGVSPGTATTGFPPGIVGGATHAGDASA